MFILKFTWSTLRYPPKVALLNSLFLQSKSYSQLESTKPSNIFCIRNTPPEVIAVLLVKLDQVILTLALFLRTNTPPLNAMF